MIGYYLELHKFLMLVARTSDLELLITRDPLSRQHAFIVKRALYLGLLITRGRPPFPSTRLHCKESLMSVTFDNQGETPWNPSLPSASARLQCKEDFIPRTLITKGGTRWNPPFLSRQHSFIVKRASYVGLLIT